MEIVLLKARNDFTRELANAGVSVTALHRTKWDVGVGQHGTAASLPPSAAAEQLDGRGAHARGEAGDLLASRPLTRSAPS